MLLYYLGRQFDLFSQLVLYLVLLFSGCMLCHGELARSKPAHGALTAFLFSVSHRRRVGRAFG
ncbi:hypothetical protein [Alishewanella longhuensis]